MKVDLSKLLKKGDIVYSIINDKMMKIAFINDKDDLPIGVSSLAGKAVVKRYNKYGSIFPDGCDTLLFPSKAVQSWDDFCRFQKGEPVFAYNEDSVAKTIGLFSHYESKKYFLFTFIEDGNISYQAFDHCECIHTIIPPPVKKRGGNNYIEK